MIGFDIAILIFSQFSPFRLDYAVLWPLTVAYITSGVAGIVGNILVCVVISRSEHFVKTKLSSRPRLIQTLISCIVFLCDRNFGMIYSDK